MVDPTDIPPGPISSDPLIPFVHTIVHAADMRKGLDIVALRVTQCTSLTNFIILISGTSRPQNQAIANSIQTDVTEIYNGKRCLGKGIPEGTADSGWIVLDYGEVMVHVMTPKSRLFYDIEGQWRERGGEYLDLSDVLVDELNAAAASSEEDGKKLVGLEKSDEDEEEMMTMRERLDVEKEEDPFWS
jgi:ribosome-associated protein